MKMAEIARALGLSRTTVSLTLNGHADRYGIAEATQARILEYVDTVGYVPNYDAASLAKRKTSQVGIIIPANPQEFTEAQRAIFFGLLDYLRQQEMIALIQSVDATTCLQAFRFFAGKGVDHIVVIGFAAATYCECRRDWHRMTRHRQVYFLDYLFHHQEADSRADLPVIRIGIDRWQAFADALNLLVQHGHQRIAVASGATPFITVPEDDAAIPRIFKLQEATAPADFFERGRLWLPEVQRLMREEGCTAALLRDDMMALGLIAGLCEAGVDVPGQFSVIGLDNIPAGAYARVPLATIEIPAAAMLAALCEHLHAQGNHVRHEDHLLPAYVIQRASLGPAPVTAPA
ncbi:MAG: LacI family DNA-binding transcriptional regulator [Armatimonadota bacterium]